MKVTETAPTFIVMAFTARGAETIHESGDQAAAKAAYEGIEHGTWCESTESPDGTRHNAFIGRK